MNSASHIRTLTLLTSILYLCVTNRPLQAAEASSLQDKVWTEYGVRPLAMGNAFVAIADDENAFYYNAAGLAFQKKSYSVVPFEFQSSTKVLSNLVEYISTLFGFCIILS